ncbi:MAG: hypothetical protein ABS75_14210 [Pelagibacterium sp. SCN 63-23]|nr:MAG: hypothetical protein ABS75_14210 [Pelagibacterium sp. SCN 63-23]
MTDTPTKEAVFKQRFINVLADLQQDGVNDAEVMAMVGNLASDLADSLEQTSWSGAKRALSATAYDALLSSFVTRGNEHHQKGEHKEAYAIQVLTVSLVVATQRKDPELARGEELMDEVIDYAVSGFRQAMSSLH